MQTIVLNVKVVVKTVEGAKNVQVFVKSVRKYAIHVPTSARIAIAVKTV